MFLIYLHFGFVLASLMRYDSPKWSFDVLNNSDMVTLSNNSD